MDQLSTAKETAFKDATWPVELLKVPSASTQDTLIFRKGLLKLIGKVLHHFSSDCLMHLAELISEYFTELSSNLSVFTELSDLPVRYLSKLCSVGFRLNNLVPLDRRNFGLFCKYIASYYEIGFESPLHELLMRLYASDDSKAEEILGFGISWIKGLLDNPALWVSDMIYSDRDADVTGEAEAYLEKHFFT